MSGNRRRLSAVGRKLLQDAMQKPGDGGGGGGGDGAGAGGGGGSADEESDARLAATQGLSVTNREQAKTLSIQGWLWKKGGDKGGLMSRKNWKQRFVKLNSDTCDLSWYESEHSQDKQKGAVNVSQATVEPVAGGKYQHHIVVKCKDDQGEDGGRELHLRMRSAAEYRAWFAVLSKASETPWTKTG